jgi:hypothetical protein
VRVKATIEAPGDVVWAADAGIAKRVTGFCMVGSTFPKELYVDGRKVGLVGAISHMNTEEVYADSMVPFRTLVQSTTLDCILDL